MKTKLSIFKIGGKILENEPQLFQFLQAVQSCAGAKIIVHGGGPKATQLAEQLNIVTQMVEGRRITNAAMLEVAVMVYAGLLNKKIVAVLQALGVNAIGLSGADANTILAQKRSIETIDFGFVGDIKKVDGQRLHEFIKAGLLPVFCAITHDGNGQLLNTNADTIARQIAVSLSSLYETELTFCFEQGGVLESNNGQLTVIKRLNFEHFQQLKGNGTINNGMIPKLDNAFKALQNGVTQVRITKFNRLQSGTQITLD